MANKRAPGAEPEGPVTETVRAGDAALTVTGTDAAAVAVGQAEAVKGAPAAGQGHAAEPVHGPAVRDVRVPDGADALRRPALADAPADPARRTALDAPLGDHERDGGTADHLGDHLGTFPRAGRTIRTFDVPARPVSGAVARRTGRDAILPLSAPTIDPETVPGRRLATAAAQVRRDGVSYAPGETFPIDFRAHAELVPIGAIEATPWHDLPDHEG